MKASTSALAGALVLAGAILATLPASAQEQVDMRSTLAGQRGQGYPPAYGADARGYGAPTSAYTPYRAVTAHGRYGMRYSGYGGAPAYAASSGYGLPRGDVYADGRSEPRLIGRGDADYGPYGGGPLMTARRGGYADGGDLPYEVPQYSYGRRYGDGYGLTYDRRYASGGQDGAAYPYEPYGYRGGRGYAGPYGYGYDYGAEEVRFPYDRHIDRYSGFVAPPPHDSRDARELRAYCGCDDEDDGY